MLPGVLTSPLALSINEVLRYFVESLNVMYGPHMFCEKSILIISLDFSVALIKRINVS